MRATPITGRILQVTQLRFVNAYLVREQDGFTLVDTATSRAAGTLIRIAEEAGGPISRIVLTHGHGDHVGGVDRLREILGDEVPVLMPELDARIHSGEHDVGGRLPGSWPRLRTVPDKRLVNGDRIRSLEAVDAAGHTPGHMAFRDTRDGTLIAGDAFTSYGKVAVPTHFQLRFPFAAMATWDRERALESARRLSSLQPTLLAVGHGPAVPDPSDAMNAAIARAMLHAEPRFA